MDSLSSVDAAPGQVQIAMMRKTMDAATSQAAQLLEVMPPLPRATTSRVDLLL